MSIIITLTDGDKAIKRIEGQTGETLYAALSRAGAKLNAPCGGRGRCGKCKVKVKYDEQNEQTVLACQCVPTGDCSVSLMNADSRILLSGQKETYETDGAAGYVMAVDLGTTTVACYLLNAQSGRQLSAASCLNPQRIHGADVISRLSFAAEDPSNRVLLQKEIMQMLQNAQTELLQKACLDTNAPIIARSLVGNTAMMHLAGGFDTSGIAKAPYMPAYTALHTQTLDGKRFLLGGCISGYVGADTLSAMIACDLDKAEDTVLLIDIGTNGEIVLKHNGQYTCCSCAAGPAFEGAHIACGTGAVVGAIDHVRPDGSYSTIGNAPAIGLCGSGLVDAVAYLLQEELISPVGRMSGRHAFTENVYIDPADIREVQLAKAAIAAGIAILADRAGIDLSGIDRVLLAGGFGNYISIDSACLIGLLPGELRDKIQPVGNAAGDGAKMLALSQKARLTTERLRRETNYIELSSQVDFEDIYTDNLLFETD